MERWRGKVVVVTGASSGIGAALCVRLANLGLTVIGLARREHLVQELSLKVTGDGKLHARQCNVANNNEIKETFQWVEDTFGGTDILVNNAGLYFDGSITDAGNGKLDDETVLSIMDVNFKGLVMCARQAVSSMVKRNFTGHVINISSLAAHYVPLNPNFNVYSATKHAVSAFTTALFNEFGSYKSKIKVTSVSPGLVKTGMAITNATPDTPILQPDEVVDAIVYIISTPPNVNITELVIQPVSELRL